MSDQREPPAYPIASVDSALRLLLLLRTQTSLRVAEAGEHLGVGRSTAHRLLAMLQYHGFVQQDAVTRAYLAGPVLLEIGLAAVRELDVREQVHDHLVELRDALGETSHLIVLQGRECLFLDSVESDRVLRTASRVGVVLPAHASSGGKVLLAALSNEDLRARYPAGRLPKVTARTIATRAELERELDAVRERGYAVNLGESEEEISALAAPISDGEGRVRAALAISAPASRLGAGDVEAAAAQLVTIAGRASETLGR
jgi:DNA-binding IclR family transcriptional regulator